MTGVSKCRVSRRSFLKKSVAAGAAMGFPPVVPSTVLGQYAPSKRINVGAVGVAMKLNRKLHWDPVKERFNDDEEANSMLARPQREPYVLT